jgi:hypothetical protein
MRPGVTWDWDETFGLLDPDDLATLVADWRKRGERIKELEDLLMWLSGEPID